jgi:hypothetical protein
VARRMGHPVYIFKKSKTPSRKLNLQKKSNKDLDASLAIILKGR